MTQNEKPSKTIGFEGSGELVISSPIGPAGLEQVQNSPGNTPISQDVVLQVVLSELSKLDSAGREWVLRQIQTLSRLK